jgi:hypothetical protein
MSLARCAFAAMPAAFLTSLFVEWTRAPDALAPDTAMLLCVSTGAALVNVALTILGNKS